MARDPREYSLLHGLSDFWTRFFADTAQLEAFYAATEIQLAQAYWELMAAFLGISLQDIPLFSKEYFRLVTIREDEIIFAAGLNYGQSRYVHTLDAAITQLRTLQNKVYEPTSALVETTDFDLDATDYQLRFVRDVTGQTGIVKSIAENANLLTYPLGPYADLYVNTGEPFINASEGDWVRIAFSSVGNNRTFRVHTVVDAQRVLLEGSPTLPDPTSGALRATLLDSSFAPLPGFAQRNLTVATGGSFDDLRRRSSTEQQSWGADSPIGLGVRKGDILHVLDREAVPTVPSDYIIGVVRHDRVYLKTTTPAPTTLSPKVLDEGCVCTVDPVTDVVQLTAHSLTAGTKVLLTCTGTFPTAQIGTQAVNLEDLFVYVRDVTPNSFKLARMINGTPLDFLTAGTGTLTIYTIGSDRSTKLVRDYVVLRVPENTAIVEELLNFAQTGTPKTGSTGEIIGDVIHVTGGAVPFAASDKQRFVTLTGADQIVGAVCHISIENEVTVLRRIGPTGPDQPFARSGTHGTVRITSGTQAGTCVILSVFENGDAIELDGPLLTPEDVFVDVDVVTNDGTYRVRDVSGDGRSLYLDQPLTYPDGHTGAITWIIHDGFAASLDHTRIRRGTLSMEGGIGSTDTGGYRVPAEDVDYVADYEAGTLIQVGRLAGTWSVGSGPCVTHATYQWLKEVFSEVRGAVAVLQTEAEIEVYEIAFWAPDIRVDHFRLYDNFGALINRFQPSSEDYRQFIRGVFQLYLLGPTLERIESALNVICNMPVIRDDSEVLTAYDDSSDADHLIVRTQRTNGDAATYLFPLDTPLREDVTSYVPGVSAAITFQSFEPLTTLFQVTDYIQDPTWWDSIVLPQEIMPGASTWRRTTMPQIYENVVGQIDEPHVGDPGLFIGADEDGVVPTTGNAKRRKMANIVVDKYIKRNLFYVHFDLALADLFPPSFINDLRELVLIAKPGYALAYVEPTSSFHDEMHLGEQALTFQGELTLIDPAKLSPDRPLLVGGDWHVGDAFRRGGAVPSEALLTADGVGIPAPVTLGHDHLTVINIHSPGEPVLAWHQVGGVWVPKDYTVDYLTGEVTPLTVWPAGAYTVEYSWYLLIPAASVDPADGDTLFFVGGPELYFGSLGERFCTSPEEQVLSEQPLQIAVVPV
jgi:hypothetical protein